MTKTTRYVLLGQSGFLFFLFVCLLLQPHYLFEANEGGISNFGVHAMTVVLYSLAFGLAAYFTYKAAHSLTGQSKPERTFRLWLTLLSTLYALTLLSTYPYKVNRIFDMIHQSVGGSFVIFVLVFSGWLVTKILCDFINVTSFLIQLTAFALAVANFFDVVHLLFVSEALTAIGFGIVFVRTTDRAARLSSQHDKRSSPH